jgi:hypothetical protein
METAQETKPVTPAATTAKLDNKLESDPATTTEIAKTSTDTATTTDTAATDTSDDAKVATADTTTSNGKSDQTTESPPNGKRVCRRFSPAIAGLVDVPCE